GFPFALAHHTRSVVPQVVGEIDDQLDQLFRWAQRLGDSSCLLRGSSVHKLPPISRCFIGSKQKIHSDFPAEHSIGQGDGIRTRTVRVTGGDANRYITTLLNMEPLVGLAPTNTSLRNSPSSCCRR